MSASYVEYLEEQQRLLVKALKKNWTQTSAMEGSSSASADLPVHVILEDLGVLSDNPSLHSGDQSFIFEENLDNLRSRYEEELEGTSTGASQIASHEHSQAPSSIHTPTTTSPEVERSERTDPRAGESARENLLPQALMSAAESQTAWFHAAPMAQVATYPSTTPTPLSRADWRFRGQLATEQGLDQPTLFRNREQTPNFEDQMAWAGVSQLRQSFARQASQPEVSTISPSDLTLPSTVEIPDEETWARWLNERRG